jgi:4-carboxymuconolactone decarboxylase
MARLPYPDPDMASPHEAYASLPVPLNVFRMVASAETAFKPWLRYGAALLAELDLDPALRELSILEVARLSGSEYEWVQHRAIAIGVGLLEEQIEALERGEGQRLGERERAVLAFTREVVGEVRTSDAALEAVRGFLSPREVVELLLVIGHYMAVARLAETTGIEVDDPAQLAVVEVAREAGERA